jgi:hypothetical protein
MDGDGSGRASKDWAGDQQSSKKRQGLHLGMDVGQKFSDGNEQRGIWQRRQAAGEIRKGILTYKWYSLSQVEPRRAFWMLSWLSEGVYKTAESRTAIVRGRKNVAENQIT